MKTTKIFLIILLGFLLLAPAAAEKSDQKAESAPKPLESIQDILSWKRIRSSTLSDDGIWFSYRLAPQEGDAETIFRQTRGDKEFRFKAGEAPRYSRSQSVAVSKDSKWGVFTIYPEAKKAKALKNQKEPLYNTLGLVNLITGDKKEFKKIRSFSFSNEFPGWLVMHKYPPRSQNKEKGKETLKGSDLILYELSTGNKLNIGNVSEFSFNKKGDKLAWIIDANEKSGNGVLIRNMRNGVISPLDSEEAVYKNLQWSKEGDALAALKGISDEEYEDELYSLVGFYGFSKKGHRNFTYNPQKDGSFPKGMTISSNRPPVWTENLNAVFFGIHEAKKKEEQKSKDHPDEEQEKKEKEEEKKITPPKKDDADKEDTPNLVIWHWKDKRLQSMQQIQEERDKKFNYVSLYRIREKKFIRLADDEVRNVSPALKGRWAIGWDDQKYTLRGNMDGIRVQDTYAFDLMTGERRLILEKCRWNYFLSPDGSHYFYYQDGHFFTYEMESGQTYNITKNIPSSFINTEDDHNVPDPPVYPHGFGWTDDGKFIFLSDNWDIWQIPVHGGKGINLTVNGKSEGIRYGPCLRLDPEEKGINLSKPIYLYLYGEWTKKSGFGIIRKGKPGVEKLIWDDASFSLRKAKDADVFLYTRQTFKDYPDFYVTNASLKKGVKISNAIPQQKDFLWSSGARLIDYVSDKGDKLQAALYLPANYEEGKSYPTIVYFYEKLSQRLHSYMFPSSRGFSAAVYTSRGYAVLTPDIVYKINDPGMSAVWCVLPAVKGAIATGVVDENRIGIHGHSWGGYQSSFLITQTPLFKACVTGAPLTNMISMYNSIYWNTGSANQPIFESSQGRFSGGYWDNLESYQRNSPVYYAKNVVTPTIILHNDKDGAVDWNQGIEYFNTLRRLGKPVVMLQYVGENHGLKKPPNQKDYTIRMREFFDHHLMGKPAPEWWNQGISHLDHEKHLKEYVKKVRGEK